MRHWNKLVVAMLLAATSVALRPVHADTSSKLSETERLAILCKVWGFVKYYHPSLADGKTDWDTVLIDSIDSVRKSKNRDTLNAALLRVIEKAGPVVDQKPWIDETPAKQKLNLDLAWLANPEWFTSDVRTKLAAIRDAVRSGRNRWAVPALLVGNTTHVNEIPFKEPPYPDEARRLLAIFRYWNVIEYFFPYKYVIGSDWNDVLTEFVPRVCEAGNELEYHLVVLELTTRIEDGHASTTSSVLNRHFGTLVLPVALDHIDGKAVVSRVYESLPSAGELRPGDIVLEIDGQALDDFENNYWKYAKGSNKPARHREVLVRYVRLGTRNHSTIRIRRGTEFLTVTVKRYSHGTVGDAYRSEAKPAWTVVEKDIGYVNMAFFEKEHIKDAMQELKDTRGIVFDMRAYPNFILYDLLPHLSPDVKPFCTVTKPDISRPGVFVSLPPLKVGPKTGIGALFSKKPTPFKGQVVVLVNERTKSRAEFFTMALQTCPHVTIIGSQTAGADGNVSWLLLPGGIKTAFTGLGVYYPDGRETQRSGIVPDIRVRPTVEGLQRGKDEVLDRAIQFLNEDE